MKENKERGGIRKRKLELGEEREIRERGEEEEEEGG